jgi:two-component system sensor histidine kinase YesM
MATIQNATGIAEMTTALSRLLKILSKDVRKMVSLRDELALLDDYMVIQKYRYGDSVNFEKQVQEDALLDTPIPRFILQPLVENAIFHGIEPRGRGTILFSAQRQEADVLVSLSDDGVGMDSEAVYGTGINNIDERLRNAFGDGYGLTIKSDAGNGTTVIIRLPSAPWPGGGE